MRFFFLFLLFFVIGCSNQMEIRAASNYTEPVTKDCLTSLKAEASVSYKVSW